MNRAKIDKFRAILRAMAARLDGTVAELEDEARSMGGDQGPGNLSNTPLHLGDLGTDAFMQEMSATVYENEEYLRGEVAVALARIDQGAFGTCEHCGKPVPVARLDTLPYTRYCVKCSEELHAGRDVNLNHGRPGAGCGALGKIGATPDPLRGRPGSSTSAGQRSKKYPEISFTDLEAAHGPAAAEDLYAIGTAAGGTASGGLAGTNIGHGDPAGMQMEEEVGSRNFDTRANLAGDDDEPEAGTSHREAKPTHP